jgi:hypothetical protein
MTTNSLVRLLFNRGGIGPSISRSETIERVNPLIEQHVRLNHHYEYVIQHSGDADAVATLKDLQKTARADVGKLSEIVFSCGGTAYNGTDLEPGDFDLGDDDTEMLFQLQDLEEAFKADVDREIDEVDHQIRTRAILEVVQKNSDERLTTLRTMTKRKHRQTPAP